MLSEISLTSTCSQFVIPGPHGPIPARSWGHASECKAVALLVHGIGAHSAWFEAFARQLKVRRIHAVSYDQIGFGSRRSEQFDNHSQWLDELNGVFDYLRATAPDCPIYLLGNSMGGLLGYLSLEYIEPDGVVLLSPGLDGHPSTFTNWYRAVAIVKALMKPQLEIALPYGVEAVTRDPGVRQWLLADPERRFSVPGKMLLELLALTKRIRTERHPVKAPLLMMTAGHDIIVNNAVNQDFYEHVSAPMKKHIHYPDAYHDLMFDYVLDDLAQDFLNWTAETSDRSLITS